MPASALTLSGASTHRVERARAFGGYLQLACHLLSAFGLVPLWFLAASPATRRKLERRFFARALRALGVAAAYHGQPEARPGTLYVANHISFTDVLVLARKVDALFVAKSEVRRFPVIGPLAEACGTIFVDRTRRSDSTRQAGRVGAALAAGRNVVLFPEGTTSDGTGVLAFRTALFAAASEAGAVQPVALRYSDGARRAYVGAESLVANLLRLARWSATVDVAFLPPISGARGMCRKSLARETRRSIAAWLADDETRACPSRAARAEQPGREIPSDHLPPHHQRGCKACQRKSCQ